MSKLTDKQQRFVEEYLIDLNATQAAIRSGYSKNTARSIANNLLTKVNIQEAIQEAKRNRSDRNEIDQDWVIKNLKENLQRAMQTIPVLDREGKETGEFQYQGNVANRALELIGKHLGMFITKIEHGFSLEDILESLPAEFSKSVRNELIKLREGK